MGIFIILVALFIIGLICHIVYQHTCVGEWCFGVGLVSMCLSGFLLVLCLAISLSALSNADLEYGNMLEQKAAIEYRLEHLETDNNLVVNGGVYNDIVEYNNTIRYYRKWGRSNFWTGWFNPAPINELEYIDLYKDVS